MRSFAVFYSHSEEEDAMTSQLTKVSAEQRLMEWAEMVRECRSSELTCREWCAQHGITERKYHYWQKRVFEQALVQREQRLGVATPKEADPQFVELPASACVSREVVASIRMGNTSIELYTGADPAMVKALCQALKPC